MKLMEVPFKTKFNGNDTLYLRVTDTPGLNQIADEKTGSDWSRRNNKHSSSSMIVRYAENKLRLHHQAQQEIKKDW
jgi:hypothetical protein